MIRLVSPTGERQRLRWTDQHARSRYGLGVVLHARGSQPMTGTEFAKLAAEGWVIECGDERELRRVAGALAWATGTVPEAALCIAQNNPENSA